MLWRSPTDGAQLGASSAVAVVRMWTVRVLLALAEIASAGAIAVARAEAKRRRGDELIVMHRMLHGDPDGCWTWCVRGAQVQADPDTDVCLEIDPAADSHYCPDCLIGAVRWKGPVGAGLPRAAVECWDCGSLFGLACVSRRE